MTDAYVNAIVNAGAVSPAAREIGDLDAVSDVHVVTGEYDIIAQVNLEHADDLPQVVAEEIHDVSGVVDTTTNVAFKP